MKKIIITEKTVIGLVGIFFILLGIVCNEWVLKVWFSVDNYIELKTRVLIWLFNIMFILVGSIIFWKSKKLSVKKLFFGGILALLLLILFEIFSYFYLRWDASRKSLEKINLKVFPKGFDIKQLSEENQQVSKGRFEPYLMYLHPSFSGKYVSTNEMGFRDTPQYFKKAATLDITIGFFGGSTAFGFGATSDSMTVPAQLARILNQRYPEVNFRVLNFGVGAYNNLSEMILLIGLLGKYHFDYVIFYDGVNEVGRVLDEDYITRQGITYKIFSPAPWERMTINAMEEYLDRRHLSIEQKIFGDKLYSKKFLEKTIQTIFIKLIRHESNDNLPAEKNRNQEYRILQKKTIMEQYKRNLDIINALSKQYKFIPLFVLQPNLFTKKELTDGEKSVYNNFNKDALQMYQQTYLLFRQEMQTNSNFIDISGCIQTPKDIYYDYCHMSDVGYGLVADSLANRLTIFSDSDFGKSKP